MIFRATFALVFMGTLSVTACSGSSASPSAGSAAPTETDGTTPGQDGSPGSSGSSGGGQGQTGTDGGSSGKPGPSVGSSGCGAAAGTSGLVTKTTHAGGATRTYHLVVPDGYDGKSPLPLAFVFHGLGGDAAQIRSYLNMEKQAAGKALFVYPEGVPQASFGGRTAWDVSDVAFFDAMLSDISKSHCVDSKRVFAAGHSFGGYMTNLVGCERGDVVRAIAPVSGGLAGGGACKGPVAAWISHGESDATVRQSEGIAARDAWLKMNHCGSTTSPTPPDKCVSYEGCSEGYPVVWCSFAGMHRPAAYTPQAIWDFFKTF